MRINSASQLSWPEDISPVVAAALDSPNRGAIIFDSDVHVLYTSPMLGTLLGLSQDGFFRGEQLINLLKNSSELSPDWAAKLEDECRKSVTFATERHKQLLISTCDGKRTLSANYRRLGDRCWICALEDVTSRRDSELRLLNTSMHDPLTGLGNRAQFEQNVTATLSKGIERDAAVLLIDLDRFKAVNDTLGHAAGDALLKVVGERIRSLVSDPEAAARLGGDEFAIMIDPFRSREEIEVLAKRSVDLLGRTYIVGGQVVNVGASVGIAIAPKDGNSPGRLLQCADLALYAAKDSGRSQYSFFEPAMEERAQARRKLELELRKALPLRQLEVNYRPQIDVGSKRNTGFQAVLRWQHPKRGLMESTEFEALAQELGLSLQIQDWVLRTACRDAAGWPQGMLIAVSASRTQFEGGRFNESVERVLKESSLPGNRLELEITESVLLNDEKNVLATLHKLRALGVRIAMSDFGTGYASLTQLASFPFDRIRIDRSLTEDHSANARHHAIVQAIASLGASLGISTTAQDIGTSGELDRIHLDGCASLQGYLLTRPVRAQEVAGFFEASASAQRSAH